MNTQDTLIKLKRRYTDHEVISALYKRLAEKDVAIRKLKSYLQETEPYKELLVINKGLRKEIKRLRQDKLNLIYENNQKKL